MLLSIHVHFLIITYIHISCIFLELVSQCASVRMTQFFYIYIYSIHGKVYRYCLDIELLLSNFQLSLSNFKNCYCPTLNGYCPIFNCHCLILKTVTVQL